VVGARILEPIAAFAGVIPIVRQHHEWFDGNGYPDGAAGEEIDLKARIFAVADCYDALVSDRPYRRSLGRVQAIEYIREGSGTHFDPRVVEAFLAIMVRKAGTAESDESQRVNLLDAVSAGREGLRATGPEPVDT
jgi:HD-GYP domain-containing protein (c-di-GMP phosphodiesterase class II)